MSPYRKQMVRRATLVPGLASLLVAGTLIGPHGANAATFKVRLMENQIPPGLSDGVQFLDQITITNSGRLFFGGDTTAGASDDFFYTATLKPFELTLAMQEGTTVVGEPGVVYVRADAVNDMNEAGDFVFVAETDPGVLDSVFKNGASVVREGGTLVGEIVNSLHQPQIDGTGSTWFVADIGGDSATDIALFRDSTLIFREGGMIDGIPISSISTSEKSPAIVLPPGAGGFSMCTCLPASTAAQASGPCSATADSTAIT